jgi:hypothetical protein
MTDRVRHLVGVWNPSYAEDAMDSTVACLLARTREFRQRDIDADDVYVWWGKVKSSNRQQPLPHLKDILAMDASLSSDGGADREVHLYLTDYRSLYVGHIAEVLTDDVSADAYETNHVPGFYRERGLTCDCWFRLFDIRRVVADDTVAVVAELKKLRNTRYNDRPVSIYGGMVELPLIVTRDDGARYFDADVRAKLIDGRFWVEFDAEHAGVGEMERELRDNVVGEAAWNALDPAARTFVATAESLFRAHRKDAAFDFSAVVINFAKAVEFQANLTLRSGLARLPESERRANVDGRSVDLSSGELWPLGTLSRVIGDVEHINRALRSRLTHGPWVAASLPPLLAELADLRNPAAHSRAVSSDEARKLRDRVLGVGGVGILADLGRVRAP